MKEGVDMFYTIISFIIVLGILVVIHEWGHFYIARRNGVRILKFSVGFGPRLFSKKVGDTEYVLSAIPLGGYVKMAGENPDEIQKAPDEFASKTVWQRAQIVFAGPFMNLVLAFALMPIVFLIGTEVPAYLDQTPRVGWVEENSPAQKAGILPGDTIQSVNQRNTDTWERALTQVGANPNHLLEIVLLRNGETKTVQMTSGSDEKSGVGLAGWYPEISATIGQMRKGYPAAKAGLEEGDRIVSVNGSPITHWNQMSSIIKKNEGKEIQLTVDRNGTLLNKSLIPAKDDATGQIVIGVSMGQKTVFKRYGVIESIKKGFTKTWELTRLTFDVLKQMLTLSLSLKSLGGPIMIAQLAGQAAHSGMGDLISLMAFLSLQLAIMNLLPIPVLDGGWLVFLGIEAIQGKPLNQKGMQIAQTIGFAALMTLFVVVSYNDILRYIR
ncbi:MAG: RIP metalloprotease RseP [Nitrospirae bacterium]|nr:RIP metalloprotease RseP [Nitrospirota bacterium]